MVRIVADDKIPFLEGALEGVARVTYRPGADISWEDLEQADGLVTRTRTQCNRELLEGTAVRFIASATIGHDHIDAAFCRGAGIRWTNAPGCNSSSVEQYMVSTLLYLANLRKLELDKLTLGVVGVGNVGSKVSRAAALLGMKVLLNDPPRQRREESSSFIGLEELLEQSDIITIHVPMNRGGSDNTYHMVDEGFVRRVKRGAVLINTSRGAVVDEKELLAGIRSGSLSDVVLDVFEHEPHVSKELLKAITIATPHIAGYSLDGKANGTTMSVRALSRFFELGIDNWSPAAIPVPEISEIQGDTSGKSEAGVLWEIYRQTYDVTVDDHRLRNDPDSFEHLRGNYPFRREPPAYSVRLFQGYGEITGILENLGFSVLGDYCV